MAAHAQKQTALAADLFDRAAMEMRTALQLVPASEQSSVAAVVIAKANEYEAFATDLRRSVPSSAPTVTTVTTTTTTTTTTASTTASVSLGSSASVLLALSQINELFVNAKEAERRGDRTLAKATAVKAADALMQRRKGNSQDATGVFSCTTLCCSQSGATGQPRLQSAARPARPGVFLPRKAQGPGEPARYRDLGRGDQGRSEQDALTSTDTAGDIEGIRKQAHAV